MDYNPRASAVHKSLLEIKTVGGVEKRMAIANGTLAAALTMGTNQPMFLLLAVVVHFFLMWFDEEVPVHRQGVHALRASGRHLRPVAEAHD